MSDQQAYERAEALTAEAKQYETTYRRSCQASGVEYEPTLIGRLNADRDALLAENERLERECKARHAEQEHLAYRVVPELEAEKERLQRRLDIAEACIIGGDSYSTYRAALARDAADTEEREEG